MTALLSLLSPASGESCSMELVPGAWQPWGRLCSGPAFPRAHRHQAVMPQPGKGSLQARSREGEQMMPGNADSLPHPRGELCPQAGLRCSAVTAEAKGTSNVTLLIISLYPGARCSIQSLQLTLINTLPPHGEPGVEGDGGAGAELEGAELPLGTELCDLLPCRPRFSCPSHLSHGISDTNSSVYRYTWRAKNALQEQAYRPGGLQKQGGMRHVIVATCSMWQQSDSQEHRPCRTSGTHPEQVWETEGGLNPSPEGQRQCGCLLRPGKGWRCGKEAR